MHIPVYDQKGEMFEVLPTKAWDLVTQGWTLDPPKVDQPALPLFALVEDAPAVEAERPPGPTTL